MIYKEKSLLDNLKAYVSTYGKLSTAELDLYKLKKAEKPVKPNQPCHKEPSIKAKVLSPLKTDKLIKSILLCIVEVALLIFLIICITNGSNKSLGFLGTVMIMLGTPVSIALMIFVGIKIKKTDGISSYIRAKKENEQKIRYNQKHAKEIKEALDAENFRYNNALAEYENKKKEYEIALLKYEQEVEKPMAELPEKIEEWKKIVNDFCEMFQVQLGKYFDNAILYDDGKRKYVVLDSTLKELFEYYIEKNDFAEDAQLEDFICDIYKKITDGSDDERLSEILLKVKRDHSLSCVSHRESSNMYSRLKEEIKQEVEEERERAEEKRKEWEQKYEAQKEAKEAAKEAEKARREEETRKYQEEQRARKDALRRCQKCANKFSCPKGIPNCGSFRPDSTK